MFPTPITLQVKRYSAGSKNARGNATLAFADPVDWRVHSVVPGHSAAATRGGEAGREPLEPNRDLSLIDYMVLAPDDGQVPGEYDLVVYQGDDYEVDGRPDHWSDASPWGSFGGDAPAVVRLRRAQG